MILKNSTVLVGLLVGAALVGCSSTDSSAPAVVGAGNTGNVGTGNTGNVGTGATGNVGTGNTGNVGTGNKTGTGATGNVGTGNTGNVGTGNTGNVGTGNTGNTGSGATTSTGSMAIGDGGYVTSGLWKGYAWTAAVSSTVTGASTTTVTDPATGKYAELKAGATSLCMKGSVGKASDYNGVALLGINLNQESLPPTGATEPPKLTYTPTGTGITYAVTNNGGTDLRIQIQDTSGTATGRWCTSISGKSSGTALWADFNTTCWSPSTGKAYDGKTALGDISVTVPGKDTADVPYDFCITSLGEAP